MSPRKLKKFTPEQLEIIRNVCRTKYETDDLCLFVLLLMETNLKPRHLLGSFNRDAEQRKSVLKDKLVLPAGTLFTKKHHAYLGQFKRKVKSWVGVSNASFEMLIRSHHQKK